jgi:mannosyltransferase OCH1-like enzyme
MEEEQIYIIILIVILIICLCLFITSKSKIPKVIHKVYIQHDGTIPEKLDEPIKEAHNTWKQCNPEYIIKYWGLNDCREYLRDNFSSKHLETFDCLQAYSSKCDFFRFCVVYNEGGWYSDWKQVCLVDNLLNKLSEYGDILFYYDKGNGYSDVNKCIACAFYGGVSGHPILKDAIDGIIHNVDIQFYGNTVLDVTGPCLIGKYVKKHTNIHSVYGNYLDDYHYYDNKLGRIIQHKCDKCEKGQDWKYGNNYDKLWVTKEFYC